MASPIWSRVCFCLFTALLCSSAFVPVACRGLLRARHRFGPLLNMHLPQNQSLISSEAWDPHICKSTSVLLQRRDSPGSRCTQESHPHPNANQTHTHKCTHKRNQLRSLKTLTPLLRAAAPPLAPRLHAHIHHVRVKPTIHLPLKQSPQSALSTPSLLKSDHVRVSLCITTLFSFVRRLRNRRPRSVPQIEVASLTEGQRTRGYLLNPT